jgi:hypothetical protein
MENCIKGSVRFTGDASCGGVHTGISLHQKARIFCSKKMTLTDYTE